MKNTSGSCGKFGIKLFTAIVIRARQKNADMAGPTSSPRFGQRANAAVAAVAKKSVIELSARPTSLLCFLLFISPNIGNAQSLEEKLDSALQQIEVLQKNQTELRHDIEQLKNAKSNSEITTPELQPTVQVRPKKKLTYGNGLAVSAHPGKQVVTTIGTIIIDAFPMDHSAIGKEFDSAHGGVTYIGNGELRVRNAGEYSFIVIVSSKSGVESLCSFSLDVNRDRVISVRKMTIGKKQKVLSFQGDARLSKPGAYKMRTRQYCDALDGITWDLQMLPPGFSAPISLNSEYIFHLMQ